MKRFFNRLLRSIGIITVKGADMGTTKDHLKVTWSGEVIIVYYQDKKRQEFHTKLFLSDLLQLKPNHVQVLGDLTVERVRHSTDDFMFTFKSVNGKTDWIKVSHRSIMKII